MALCCDFLARRLSLFTDIGQRAKLEKRRERLLAHHNVSWLNLWNAAAAYHHALLGSTDSIPEAYRRHRLFTVRTLAPGKPMIEMIENQVSVIMRDTGTGRRIALKQPASVLLPEPL